METFKIFMKALAITLLTIIGIVFLSYLVCYSLELTCKTTQVKVVAEIGGCNRGNCAVRFSDGSKGYSHLPLIGDKVSVCIKE